MSVTLLLVIFTSLISLWAFSKPELIANLKHFPSRESKFGEYYRMLTSGFLHGDYIHLFLNMFVLHEFGRYVENHIEMLYDPTLGKIIYVFMYLFMIVAADIPTFIKHRDNPYFSSVGASGAVSGIVFIYILLNPWAMLGLFAIIPIPAIVFGVLYLWYSSWASKNSNDLVDHDAHFYGALTGILFMVALQPGILSIFIQNVIEGFPF